MLGINYIAIIVAALANFVIGWLWYGVLFKKPWMALMGMVPGQMPGGKFSPTTAMTIGAIATLITTFVLAIFVGALGVTTVVSAALLAFWIWLGFVATTVLNTVLYENRSWKLFWINALYPLVGLVVSALILALW